MFKNPITTGSAIDRLVHHSVMLEFAVPSRLRRGDRVNGGAHHGREAGRADPLDRFLHPGARQIGKREGTG